MLLLTTAALPQRGIRPVGLRRQHRRPTADEIWSLARNRHDGITRTDVSNLFSRNKKAREIDRALQALIDAGRLERATMEEPRTGRALTVWRPAGPVSQASSSLERRDECCSY